MRTDSFDFTDWRNTDLHKGKHFIIDGIIDHESWKHANLKILFLAKEAYGEITDLCEFLRDEGPVRSWNTVVDWTYAINKIFETVSIPDFRPGQEFDLDENWNKWLRKVAVVNIKKSGGTAISDNENLMKYANEDACFLREQIDWINPDIIFCCYTYTPGFYNMIYPNSNTNKISAWCFHHKLNGKTRLIIDFWHFANQYPNEMVYYALCAILIKYKTTVKP